METVSVKDMMINSLQNIKVARSCSNKTEILRARLNSDSDYAYCPYCARQERKKNKDWKTTLCKLWHVRYGEFVTYDNLTAIAVTSDSWFCDNCHREITIEDFRNVYCSAREPKSKVIDLTKVNINDPNFAMQYWFGK